MAWRRSKEVPTGLTPILLPGETLVTAVRAHWAKLAEPFASTFAALVFALWVDANLTKPTQAVGTVVWWVFIAVLVRLLWRLLDWNHSWFVATDKRLLLRYGLISHKVAMMPLAKVTDMSYVRSIPGQFLGYGKFVLESAGQDQALREIKWVPNPDQTYRDICAEIFHIVPPQDDEDLEVVEVDGTDPADGAAGGSGGPGGPGGSGGRQGPYGGPFSGPDGGPITPGPTPGVSVSGGSTDPAYPDVNRIHNPVQDRLDSWSRAVPVRKAKDGEPIYQSEDLRKRPRGADTGPIWPPP